MTNPEYPGMIQDTGASGPRPMPSPPPVGGAGNWPYLRNDMVLPDRIELSTSPLPRECSTTELRQRRAAGHENLAARRAVPCHMGGMGASAPLTLLRCTNV